MSEAAVGLARRGCAGVRESWVSGYRNRTCRRDRAASRDVEVGLQQEWPRHAAEVQEGFEHLRGSVDVDGVICRCERPACHRRQDYSQSQLRVS